MGTYGSRRQVRKVFLSLRFRVHAWIGAHDALTLVWLSPRSGTHLDRPLKGKKVSQVGFDGANLGESVAEKQDQALYHPDSFDWQVQRYFRQEGQPGGYSSHFDCLELGIGQIGLEAGTPV